MQNPESLQYNIYNSGMQSKIIKYMKNLENMILFSKKKTINRNQHWDDPDVRTLSLGL